MDNLGYLVAYLLFVGMLLVKEKKIEEENEEAHDEQETTSPRKPSRV
jgi:hypothetical protein